MTLTVERLEQNERTCSWWLTDEQGRKSRLRVTVGYDVSVDHLVREIEDRMDKRPEATDAEPSL
jgi:hypothetical protein